MHYDSPCWTVTDTIWVFLDYIPGLDWFSLLPLVGHGVDMRLILLNSRGMQFRRYRTARLLSVAHPFWETGKPAVPRWKTADKGDIRYHATPCPPEEIIEARNRHVKFNFWALVAKLEIKLTDSSKCFPSVFFFNNSLCLAEASKCFEIVQTQRQAFI